MSELDADIEAVLVSADEIKDKIAELAKEIDADYAGREPLLVGVLKGAAMFMSDLARALERPSTMEFMAVSSYGSVDPVSRAWCASSRTSTATSPASTS